jgi:hypothetical protein
MFVPVIINFQDWDDAKFVISCSSGLRRNSRALCVSLICFTHVLSSPIAIKVKLSLCLIKHQAWIHIGEWRYSSTIFDLGTKWRWVVSFVLLLLYPSGSSPRYPLDRRLGGPQNRSERNQRKKKLAPAGNRTPAVRRYCYTGFPLPDVTCESAGNAAVAYRASRVRNPCRPVWDLRFSQR